jgi:hypothetical protein
MRPWIQITVAPKKEKKGKTRRTAFCYPIDSVKWNFDIYLIA